MVQRVNMLPAIRQTLPGPKTPWLPPFRVPMRSPCSWSRVTMRSQALRRPGARGTDSMNVRGEMGGARTLPSNARATGTGHGRVDRDAVRRLAAARGVGGGGDAGAGIGAGAGVGGPDLVRGLAG